MKPTSIASAVFIIVAVMFNVYYGKDFQKMARTKFHGMLSTFRKEYPGLFFGNEAGPKKAASTEVLAIIDDGLSLGERVHVSFCNRTMKGAHRELIELLKSRNPDAEVISTEYPIPYHKVLLSYVFSAVQVLGLAVVFMGDTLFKVAGMEKPPSWYERFVENKKFGMAIGVWYFGSWMSKYQLQSGAFEVFYNGSIVWSKLDCGFLPSLHEILDAFYAAGLQ